MEYSFEDDVGRMVEAIGDRLHPGFTFANVGASDGVASDPIFPLAQRLRARGVAAEPVPYIYERLVANYGVLPDVRCEQVAISDQAGTETMWFLAPDSGAFEYITQSIGSLDKSHLLETISSLRELSSNLRKEIPVHPDHQGTRAPIGGEGWPDDLESHVRSVEVEVITFEELLGRAGLEQVDMVNIDLEGRDFPVFTSIDWARWNPRVLVLETYHMTPVEASVVADTLDPLGFEKVSRFGLFSDVYVRT